MMWRGLWLGLARGESDAAFGGRHRCAALGSPLSIGCGYLGAYRMADRGSGTSGISTADVRQSKGGDETVQQVGLGDQDLGAGQASEGFVGDHRAS